MRLAILFVATSLHAQGAPARFELNPTPTFVLSDDGTDERQFTRVLARRLLGGEVVVGDPDQRTIRIFGRDGRVVKTLATPGNGPGEMPGSFLLELGATDTILALGQPPSGQPNVYTFASSGFVMNVRPVDDAGRSLWALEHVAAATFVVQRGGGMRRLTEAPMLGELVADSTVYGLYSRRGDDTPVVTWLAPVVRQWSFAHPWPRGPLATMLSPYPLGPSTIVIASHGRVWIVDSGSGAVRAVDVDGKEVLSTTLDERPRWFEPDALQRRRARALASATRALDSARANTMVDPALLPQFMPLVSGGVAAADGGIWLQQFSVDETAPRVFVHLNRSGVRTGELRIQRNIDVQQIGSDFVLGVRHENDGTLSVVEYAYRRN